MSEIPAGDPRRGIEIVAINCRKSQAVDQHGNVYPITGWYDKAGDEVDGDELNLAGAYDEMMVCVVKISSNLYMGLMLDDYPPSSTN